ncbi:MAG: malate dehydrogenase [Gammaproteobacteria bacterium]|nr:malate dehydrogenase [Gammaproteobacteria bacterium]
MKKTIITITGAAGNIAYSLIFRILSGNIFPDTHKIQINLLDLAEALPILKGVKYEIEDCAFPNLENITITDNPELAFMDSNYILLVGAKPRFKGMQRADLLLDNANIFQKHAKIINECVGKDTKIVVVGNPANTNALILQNFAHNLPAENITSLMKLDQNRAKSILANKLDKSVKDISQLVVWGNHSVTQFPDLNHALVSDSHDLISSLDKNWINDIFIPRVQKRGAEIIEHRGKSSAASAASAIYDHLSILVNGSIEWESMGIIRENNYNICDQIFFSFPLKISTSNIDIINDLDISENSMKYIKDTEKELLVERDIIKDILKN